MSDFTAKITISAIDKVTSVTKKVESSLDRLKMRASSVGQSFSALGTATSNFGSHLRSAVIQIAAAGAGFFYFTKRAGEMGESLLNAAQRAGITVEALQKLRYAARLGGIEAGDMDTALKFLNKSMTEAATNPKSEQAKAFKSMRIHVRDANGEIKNAGDVLLEVADKFKKAEDGPKKVTTAFTIMGRGGTTMIPILNEGSESFKKLAAEADKLGIVLSAKEAHKLDDYGDSIQRMEAAVGGLSNQIVLALAPSLIEITNGMTEYIIKNKELLKINVSSFLTELGKSLVEIWKGLKVVVDAIKPFIEALGGIKTVVIALTTIYFSSLILSFANLVIAIGAVARSLVMLSAAFIATPFGLVITALGLIAYGAYKLYQIWPELKAIFLQAWEAIVQKFNGVVASFEKNIEGIKAAIATFISALIAPFNPLISNFNIILAVINKIKGALSSMPSPSVNVGVNGSVPVSPAQTGLQGTRFSPSAAQPQPMQTPGRLGVIAPQQPVKQKLDINMRIDADGRPRDVKAKSSAPIDFKANTGVMMP